MSVPGEAGACRQGKQWRISLEMATFYFWKRPQGEFDSSAAGFKLWHLLIKFKTSEQKRPEKVTQLRQ